MSISMHLTLLATLGVSYTILPYRRPVEACTYHLGSQRPPTHVASTDPFMELRHCSVRLTGTSSCATSTVS